MDRLRLESFESDVASVCASSAAVGVNANTGRAVLFGGLADINPVIPGLSTERSGPNGFQRLNHCGSTPTLRLLMQA